MSRRVVFTVGWCDRRVNGPGMMRCWYARFVAVLLRVVRATVSGGCGRMCWLGGMGAAESGWHA